MNLLLKHKVSEYSGQPVSIAQVKFDGYYTEVYKSKEFGVKIYHKKQNIDLWPKLRLIDAIRQSVERLPQETILRCELHVFNVHASSVPTLTNNADPRLLLSPFKIEQWDGRAGDFLTSFYMEWKLLNDHFPVVPDYISIDKVTFGTIINLSPFDINMLKQMAIKQGIEGWVVKDIPGGKCWKIKPEKTVDAFVISYKISDSDSYAGGLKSVTFAVYDGEKEIEIGTAGSGFKGNYRMSVDPKSLIGRVGEFGYQSLGAKGRLKFPKFLRWRDDEKTARQCLMEQLSC